MVRFKYLRKGQSLKSKDFLLNNGKSVKYIITIDYDGLILTLTLLCTIASLIK